MPQLLDLSVAGQQQVYVNTDIRRCDDQGVRHSQGSVRSTQFCGPAGDVDPDWHDRGNNLCEESLDRLLVVTTQLRSGQNLGVRDRGDNQPPPRNQLTNCGIRG